MVHAGGLLVWCKGPGGVGSFPEALIIEVLDYCGDPFYADEPKWVPILPMTGVKEGTRMTRTQFPVVAGVASHSEQSARAYHQRGGSHTLSGQQALPTGSETWAGIRCLYAIGELPHDCLQAHPAVA